MRATVYARPPIVGEETPEVLGYVERNRQWLESFILAAVLPGVAGSVNASSIFVVGSYVSHVTGSVARIGDELAQGHSALAMGAASLVACFFLGAVTATVLIEISSRRKKARYTAALGVEVSALYLFTALSPLVEPSQVAVTEGQFLLGSILCFGMGVQNALVTRLSGAVVRTTHLTGIVTDIAIGTVRAIIPARDPDAPTRSHALRRLGVHLTIFSSFLSGAILGPVLYLRMGVLSMLVPAAVLLCLIIFDTLLGLGARVSPLTPKLTSLAEPSESELSALPQTALSRPPPTPPTPKVESEAEPLSGLEDTRRSPRS